MAIVPVPNRPQVRSTTSLAPMSAQAIAAPKLAAINQIGTGLAMKAKYVSEQKAEDDKLTMAHLKEREALRSDIRKAQERIDSQMSEARARLEKEQQDAFQDIAKNQLSSVWSGMSDKAQENFSNPELDINEARDASISYFNEARSSWNKYKQDNAESLDPMWVMEMDVRLADYERKANHVVQQSYNTKLSTQQKVALEESLQRAFDEGRMEDADALLQKGVDKGYWTADGAQTKRFEAASGGIVNSYKAVISSINASNSVEALMQIREEIQAMKQGKDITKDGKIALTSQIDANITRIRNEIVQIKSSITKTHTDKQQPVGSAQLQLWRDQGFLTQEEMDDYLDVDEKILREKTLIPDFQNQMAYGTAAGIAADLSSMILTEGRKAEKGQKAKDFDRLTDDQIKEFNRRINLEQNPLVRQELGKLLLMASAYSAQYGDTIWGENEFTEDMDENQRSVANDVVRSMAAIIPTKESGTFNSPLNLWQNLKELEKEINRHKGDWTQEDIEALKSKYSKAVARGMIANISMPVEDNKPEDIDEIIKRNL